MVREHPRPQVLETASAEDLRADLGMGADLRELGGTEPARLLQDGVGQPDLADVVQHPRDLDPLDLLGGQAELHGDQAAVAADAARVVGRARVAQVEGLGHPSSVASWTSSAPRPASGAKIAEISLLKITQRFRLRVPWLRREPGRPLPASAERP